MPIGNDLVDLRAREAAGKARDARFVARVFTGREKELIERSPGPDSTLWMLWAGKEAAYKVAKKLRPDAIFAHSRYEVIPDCPNVLLEPAGTTIVRAGHVRLRGIAGLDELNFPLVWRVTPSFIHCVAMDVAGDFGSLRIAILSRRELDREPDSYEPTARELALFPTGSSPESLAVRRVARTLAAEAGLGDVEVVRARIGSALGPPRLYPRGGALPLPGWDLTLSHDGDLAAAVLGRQFEPPRENGSTD